MELMTIWLICCNGSWCRTCLINAAPGRFRVGSNSLCFSHSDKWKVFNWWWTPFARNKPISSEKNTSYATMMRSTGIMKRSCHFSSRTRERAQEHTCEMQRNIWGRYKSMSHHHYPIIDNGDTIKRGINDWQLEPNLTSVVSLTLGPF